MRVFQHYDIAYRKKDEELFTIVEQPKYGWTADPFLVKYRGELLLFAEIFLYNSERNGVIGYCKYEDGRFGDWTVTMDRHWHLSYPNVFVKNDKLYMVPESYQLGEVVLYELISFPDKWRKVNSYISDVEYCDSTFFNYTDGNNYMFTFERSGKPPAGTGLLYKVQEGKLCDKQVIAEGLEGVRCGGNVIVDSGNYIRVAQDCKEEYGKGLIFFKIDSVSPSYKEHEIRRLYVDQIKGHFHKDYIGIHTYNTIDDLEVIDLRYASSTREEEEASERVRKVFWGKYE